MIIPCEPPAWTPMFWMARRTAGHKQDIKRALLIPKRDIAHCVTRTFSTPKIVVDAPSKATARAVPASISWFEQRSKTEPGGVDGWLV